MKIDNTQFDFSMNDTSELRKLIMANPELPLLFFVGEDAWFGDWQYNQTNAGKPRIEELTIYNDKWLDRDDYREEISNDLYDSGEYDEMTDEEFNRMVDQKVEETIFCQAIVVYFG